MEASSKFKGDVDKTQIPPLNQKRILAFVNHFLISTCTFLNEFALNCETKFVQLERQLQRTEAALIILEAKLASIPLDKDEGTAISATTAVVDAPLEDAVETPPEEVEEEPIKGVRACEDVRYKKFFKMLHVGVPAPAVKQKMLSEGLQPQMLDNPDEILIDGIAE
ncbi:WASH complex subunit 3 [Drosophila sulfurigaster albostrigata]|uniref:WASH complex subunit 3 n=1 Tax=Drosophila albomicans TaxID=7291 RepID=A0A6P8WBS1_DROAB|nr:WASH complex subunit 3 [Drosophila albomicans]XP_062128685.1 WASH complex subunit 3 [Drosophila sulfurigaster albostrigata]